MNKITLIEQLVRLKETMCINVIDIAGEYCDDHDSETSCADYHGIRFLLQHLGSNANIRCQYEVFYSGIKAMFDTAIPEGEKVTVMISGTADFVIPALVSSALRDLGLSAEITIVDLCQTPLVLCEIAAKKFNFDWKYQQSNILDLQPDKPFDLIFTDRLLGHISPDIRPELLNKWTTLLSPGGQFMMMTSLKGPTSHAELDANLNRLNLLKELPALGKQYSRQTLVQMATRCITVRNRHPIRNQILLEALFNASHLKIKSVCPVQAAQRLLKEKGPLKMVKLIALKR